MSVPLVLIEQAATWIAAAHRLTVLTGAGISAESGLATFRGPDGLWEGQRPEDVATPRAFARNPLMVWRFYNHRRANLARATPNPGHVALVRLEQANPEFTLITQNVDGLHAAAGNRNVLEIHGSLRRVRCVKCGMVEERGVVPLAELPQCPKCEGLLRPDLVWFEESLDPANWSAAVNASQECDVFLVVGTSAVVYPAAGLIDVAKRRSAKVIEVNVTPSEASARCDMVLLGPSGTILPEIVRIMGHARGKVDSDGPKERGT